MNPTFYNTQREHLRISEYGRIVQDMVNLMKKEEDRTKRNLMAAGIVNVMANLNPHLKEMADYKQKLWDHLFAIANYDLDIDSPYPQPERNHLFRKPQRIPYQNNLIRFRFYGRNVQNMILKASEMEEGETKSAFINLIASFMRNSCKSWNNENLSEEAISEHMKMLSGGKLDLSAHEITILYHNKENGRQPSNFQSGFSNNNNRRNNSNNNNKNKNRNNNNSKNRNNNNNRGNNNRRAF